MAEKRKVKRRKDEDFDFNNKNVKKPTKDEEKVAKWMKKNVAVKKTKFAGHNVEYFTGSKAVDVLMESKWCQNKSDKEPFFATRQDLVNFLNNMLRHKLFHRAKKVPVSEQELKEKMKKKDKKNNEKENKKKKEDETAESSYAEGKDTEEKKQNAKRCKKIKLEMHYDQMFIDNLDAYVWLYDPTPFYYWIIGFLVVIGAIAICLFPLWPPTIRMGVQYLSMAAAGLLILILALAVIRLIVFCFVWLLTFGTFYLWLLPNLTEDVGFFASFWPLYEYKYGKKIEGSNNKKNKKKQAKYSDNENEENENETKPTKSKDGECSSSKENALSVGDSDFANGSYSEDETNETGYIREDGDSDGQDSEKDQDYNQDGGSCEDDSNGSEDSVSYVQADSPVHRPKKPKKKAKPLSSGGRVSGNDSEETDSEYDSSQHSETSKDFEFVNKEDSDMKS